MTREQAIERAVSRYGKATYPVRAIALALEALRKVEASPHIGVHV